MTLPEREPVYFEDFVVGEETDTGPYELTKGEILDFARVWDPMPFHVDEEAARTTQFGGIIACGSHMLAIRQRMYLSRGVNRAVVASAGFEEVRFAHPARPGDVLMLKQRILEKRESASKPDRGVVKQDFTITNQNGETVLYHSDTIVVLKRPAE